LGFAYAGAGTSTFGLGSMFWNPANITNFQGRNSEYNFFLILPDTSLTTTSASLTNGTPFTALGIPSNKSGNVNQGTFTTASYNSFQINDRLWIGLQTGTPFGSRTKSDAGFAGSVTGTSSIVRGIAITPTLGFKATEWLSFGGGVTIQQLTVDLKGGDNRLLPAAAGVPAAARGNFVAALSPNRIKGDAYGIGWTAGVTIKPFQGTEIGLGFRSHIKHKLDGEIDLALPTGINSTLIQSNVNLPEIATFGISQKLTDKFTVTGTVQWTNWSRINVAPVTSRVTGAPVTALGFRYRDEYFYAIGAQYQYNDQLKLRAGAAYEISPITDETRGSRLLDNDRVWLSAGIGYKWNEQLEFDIGYSHIFLRNGNVNIVGAGNPLNPAGNPAFTAFNYSGTTKGSVDIISFSLKYRFDSPAPVAAAVVKPVVKKF
ncbi:MAG: OmpP1/FadL family transporter, partial [Beijerinckiaceae bacterium]